MMDYHPFVVKGTAPAVLARLVLPQIIERDDVREIDEPPGHFLP